MEQKLPITAVVLAHNEEQNIGRCLASLQWLDEVLVLDSGSVDHTGEIAGGFDNCKFMPTAWKGYAATKQYGVSMAKNDVIFWVDADEEIPEALQEEIKSRWTEMQANWEKHPVYIMPRKTFFMGEWIKYCGWYPDRQKRLFNRNYAAFNSAAVHEDLDIKNKGTAGSIKNDINHYSFQSISRYFEKMNQYGRLGAEEMLKKGKKKSFLKLVFNPWWAFVHSYFIELGILQGRTGFIICAGNAYGKFIKYLHFYYAK